MGREEGKKPGYWIRIGGISATATFVIYKTS